MPTVRSERMQGCAVDPVCVKGEVFAYVGLPQDLKHLKVVELLVRQSVLAFAVVTVQGYLAHQKTPPP